MPLGRVLALAGFALSLIVLTLRVLWLDSLPALDSDEAWFGAMLWRALHGQPYQLQTPTGNWITPLYAAIELPALILCGPTILALRLPVAIWSMVGILLWWRLWRRAFPESQISFWSALLYAALPLHMGYARLGWDPGLLLVTLPLVFLPAVALVEHARWSDVFLFALGCILSVWTSMITIPFIGMLICILLFMRKGDIVSAVAQRLAIGRREAWLLVGGMAMIGAVAAFFLGTRFIGAPPGEFVVATWKPAADLLTHPPALVKRFGDVGEIISGVRIYERWAGVTPGLAGRAFSWLSLGAVLWLSWKLVRSRSQRHWFVGCVSFGVPVLLVVLAGPYALHIMGIERYVLWLGPLFVLVLSAGLDLPPLRVGVKQSLLAVVVCVFVVAFWTNYLAPLRRGPDLAHLGPGLWPAQRDPKELAAAWIRAGTPSGATVYTRDWWSWLPLFYLLPDAKVLMRLPPEDLPDGECYAVEFAGDGFVDRARPVFVSRGRRELDRHVIYDRLGRPVMVVARYGTMSGR